MEASVIFSKLLTNFWMVEKSAVDKSKKTKKEREWTEIEFKYLALVLADEKKAKKSQAIRLETLALKKSANNQVRNLKGLCQTTFVRLVQAKERTGKSKVKGKQN